MTVLLLSKNDLTTFAQLSTRKARKVALEKQQKQLSNRLKTQDLSIHLCSWTLQNSDPSTTLIHSLRISRNTLSNTARQVSFKPYPSVFVGQHLNSAEIYPKTSPFAVLDVQSEYSQPLRCNITSALCAQRRSHHLVAYQVTVKRPTATRPAVSTVNESSNPIINFMSILETANAPPPVRAISLANLGELRPRHMKRLRPITAQWWNPEFQ